MRVPGGNVIHMAIIIGDIHGDLAMAQTFLAYKPEAEHVALGDLVDSRNPKTTFEDELACLELLLESEAVLLWGNHDLTYTVEKPWSHFKQHSGIIHLTERWTAGDDYLTRASEEKGFLNPFDILTARYEKARSRGRFKAAYGVDGWLCTHAGVSTALTSALPDCPWDCGDMEQIADWLNLEFLRELATPRIRRFAEPEGPFGEGPLFNIGEMRGGHDKFGGILWYDHRWEPSRPPDPRLRQLFGHTQVEGPMRKNGWINVHIDDGLFYWVFDTETDDFAMLYPE